MKELSGEMMMILGISGTHGVMSDISILLITGIGWHWYWDRNHRGCSMVGEVGLSTTCARELDGS